MFTLGEFAARLMSMDADIHEAKEIIVTRAAKMITKEAKGLIGHEQAFWPPLAESTIEDKKRQGYRVPAPLLRTGEMRDSIQWDGPFDEGDAVVAYVYSTDPKAPFHELGTKHIPPRPFLSSAAIIQEHRIYDMAGKVFLQTLLHGGNVAACHPRATSRCR
jgi:hypothetical protein